MRFWKSISIVPAVLFAAMSNPATAAIFVYSGALSGANSVPLNASLATGTFTATLDDVANSLAVSLTFSGLSATASAAHIHCCVASNANGPVIIPFIGFPTATSGSYSNIFTGISSSNIAGIEAGLAYINIHDATFPGGEIRGQLLAPVPEPATWIMLIGGFALVGSALRRRKMVVSFA